ncbi:MAG: sigma-70 family RNA polymerase sigma factor [candidate division Zixibacteria bacterium]|nr:sigma-70 family RNA polymerase sigma factor [candidate division Zixibacteria bacterium]
MEKTRQQINAILDGNPNAFTALISGHQRLVGQIVYRMIKDETEREDLCQDVFLKVYQNLRSFQYKAKLSTWIARIAYNTCLNYLEKKRTPLYEDCSPEGATLDDCPIDDASPHEWTQSRQASLRLCEEIDGLPVVYGTIVSLYHLQDMTYAEIGSILSLPDGTVKSYLFRARKMLRERMLAKYRREELCA